MPREYTLQHAIGQALLMADEKWKKGLLISSDHPDYDTIMDNLCVEGIQGDPETVYSIISLFADADDNADDTWADKIEEALRESYETYF